MSLEKSKKCCVFCGRMTDYYFEEIKEHICASCLGVYMCKTFRTVQGSSSSKAFGSKTIQIPAEKTLEF